MRSLVKMFFVAAALALTLSAGLAQPPAGGGGRGGQGGGRGQGGMMMGGFGAGLTTILVNKGVAEELKLTDEQKESIGKWAKEVNAKMMERFQGGGGGGERPDFAKMREQAEKDGKEQLEAVSKILKEDQVKRMKQIQLQIRNVSAFSTKDVQDGLKLSDEQKETIKEIMASMGEERREMFSAGGGERPSGEELQKRMAEMQKKGAELNKKYMEKVKNQLKDDQKKSWEEMVGKAFEYKAEMPQRRRDN